MRLRNLQRGEEGEAHTQRGKEGMRHSEARKVRHTQRGKEGMGHSEARKMTHTERRGGYETLRSKEGERHRER
jgi:hypothetical protein